MRYIHGITDNFKDITIIEYKTFFEEYEFNVEQLFSGSVMGLKTCKSTMLATDMIWLEEYFLMIEQWKYRVTNETEETPTFDDVWEEFNLSCIRDTFICRYGIDILNLGREGETLLSEEICSDQEDESDGGITGGIDILSTCRNTPYFLKQEEEWIYVYLTNIYDNTGITITTETTGITLETDYDTYRDRVRVKITGGTTAVLDITYGDCEYSLEVNTESCNYTATSSYNADTDTFTITLTPEEGATEITPVFYSNGFEVNSTKYTYSAEENTVTIPNASQYAGAGSLFIDYGCGYYSFTIPSKGCNTQVLSYTRTDDGVIVYISAIDTGEGSYPPGTGDISVMVDNEEVEFTLEDGSITIEGIDVSQNAQRVITITIYPCLTYSIILYPTTSVVVPSSYTQTVCGTMSLDEDNNVVITSGCDTNTYQISYSYNEIYNRIDTTITLLNTIANGCQTTEITEEYRCNEEVYQYRYTEKKCCVVNGVKQCVTNIGSWTDVEVSSEDNPCANNGTLLETKTETSCEIICNDDLLTNRCTTHSYTKDQDIDEWVEDAGSPTIVDTATAIPCVTTTCEDFCQVNDYVRRCVTNTYQYNEETLVWEWVTTSTTTVLEANSEECMGTVVLDKTKDETSCIVICDSGFLTNRCTTHSYTWSDATSEWIEDEGSPTVVDTATTDPCTREQCTSYCEGTDLVQVCVDEEYSYNATSEEWEWTITGITKTTKETNSSSCPLTDPCDAIEISGIEITKNTANITDMVISLDTSSSGYYNISIVNVKGTSVSAIPCDEQYSASPCVMGTYDFNGTVSISNHSNRFHTIDISSITDLLLPENCYYVCLYLEITMSNDLLTPYYCCVCFRI